MLCTRRQRQRITDGGALIGTLRANPNFDKFVIFEAAFECCDNRGAQTQLTNLKDWVQVVPERSKLAFLFPAQWHGTLFVGYRLVTPTIRGGGSDAVRFP